MKREYLQTERNILTGERETEKTPFTLGPADINKHILERNRDRASLATES